jgi:beta-phosphoglucomutase-like phosphatase (HAD superfamily)
MILSIPEGEFDAYIFDCDGTLIDSMPLHLDAWRAALAQHGFPPEQFTYTMHHGFAGMPGPAIVRVLNDQFGTSLPPEAVEAAKLKWYLEHHHTIKPVPAVVEIARARAGILPMAVASGSDAEIVKDGLKAIGIIDLFQTIITPADVTHGKPAPDMFLLAAKRLGVDPARCLVFEDGHLGIQAAHAAGMACVFVPTVDEADG